MYSTLTEVFQRGDMTESQYTISGKGQKGLIVFCHANYFEEAEQISLRKLISAIKLDFENDIYLIVGKPTLLLSEFDLSFNSILSFGLAPEELGLNIDYKLYDILVFDQCKMLFSESMKELNDTPSKKALLWQKLQLMFLHN